MTDKIEEIYCSFCNLNIVRKNIISDNNNGSCFFENGTDCHVCCGYGSRYDGQTIYFIICDNCIEKITEGVSTKVVADISGLEILQLANQ